MLATLETFAEYVNNQVSQTAAVPPLVVIPGQHLDHVAGKNHSAQGIEDGAVLIAFEINAYQRLIAVFQNALKLALSGSLKNLIYLLSSYLFVQVCHKVT